MQRQGTSCSRALSNLSALYLFVCLGTMCLPQARAEPKGLAGGITKIDPKAMAFETELLQIINAKRAEKKLAALQLDSRLRVFCRKEAELMAMGDKAAAKVHDRIKEQGLGPYGYMMQAAFGLKAKALLDQISKDPKMDDALLWDPTKLGAGAFWVPAEEPYFQVMVLVAKEKDPMAGKPGLSKEQTDAVMQGALPLVKTCYDAALNRDPNFGTSLLTQLVIGAKGSVTEAKMLKGSTDADFDACVLNAVRGLKFPEPYKGVPVTLNHPFQVSPPQGSRRLGKLTTAQIDLAFNQAFVGFRNCYDQRVKDNPKLSGTLTLALTVMPDGRAKNIHATGDTLNDPLLSKCVLSRAEDLRFARPKFDGEVDLTYPLTFSPTMPKKK